MPQFDIRPQLLSKYPDQVAEFEVGVKQSITKYKRFGVVNLSNAMLAARKSGEWWKDARTAASVDSDWGRLWFDVVQAAHTHGDVLWGGVCVLCVTGGVAKQVEKKDSDGNVTHETQWPVPKFTADFAPLKCATGTPWASVARAEIQYVDDQVDTVFIRATPVEAYSRGKSQPGRASVEQVLGALNDPSSRTLRVLDMLDIPVPVEDLVQVALPSMERLTVQGSFTPDQVLQLHANAPKLKELHVIGSIGTELPGVLVTHNNRVLRTLGAVERVQGVQLADLLESEGFDTIRDLTIEPPMDGTGIKALSERSSTRLTRLVVDNGSSTFKLRLSDAVTLGLASVAEVVELGDNLAGSPWTPLPDHVTAKEWVPDTHAWSNEHRIWLDKYLRRLHSLSLEQRRDVFATVLRDVVTLCNHHFGTRMKLTAPVNRKVVQMLADAVTPFTTHSVATTRLLATFLTPILTEVMELVAEPADPKPRHAFDASDAPEVYEELGAWVFWATGLQKSRLDTEDDLDTYDSSAERRYSDALNRHHPE